MSIGLTIFNFFSKFVDMLVKLIVKIKNYFVKRQKYKTANFFKKLELKLQYK